MDAYEPIQFHRKSDIRQATKMQIEFAHDFFVMRLIMCEPVSDVRLIKWAALIIKSIVNVCRG